MKIFRIFENSNLLLSFKYDNEVECEFERLFDQWNDTEYLFEYFNINQSYLRNLYWESRDVNILVSQTTSLANKFEEELLAYENLTDDEFQRNLDEMFETLKYSDYREGILRQSKSKKGWLRIYALKINKSAYVITGGAIKLTKKMDEHPATLKELEKIQKCKNYLLDLGITSIEEVMRII